MVDREFVCNQMKMLNAAKAKCSPRPVAIPAPPNLIFDSGTAVLQTVGWRDTDKSVHLTIERTLSNGAKVEEWEDAATALKTVPQDIVDAISSLVPFLSRGLTPNRADLP